MRYTSFMCGDDANVRVGNCRPPIIYGTTEYICDGGTKVTRRRGGAQDPRQTATSAIIK
jgi:hypothetical protein